MSDDGDAIESNGPQNIDVNDVMVTQGSEAVMAAFRGRKSAAEPAGASGNVPDGSGVSLNDFYAHMPSHDYIFVPSREFWPAASVNSRIPPQPVIGTDGEPKVDDKGKPIKISAAAWLDREKPVEQMTWAPGQPLLISDRLVSEGGWIERPGCSCFNLYRPPAAKAGDPNKAAPWREHVARLYPTEAAHIIHWLAHRVQRPEEKINHALVLGGAQGIGKDSILEPVKYAIGPWNFTEVSPQHMLGSFNGFVKSVILRVSEARDLGDVDRFGFYDHMKTYTAAPPDVLRVNEKHRKEYAVFNVCGVVITTNHKSDGIYLPADDRRHFVAWSELTKDDFDEAYWRELWNWYSKGGQENVAAYLRQLDLSRFNAKAPPPKTEAFWAIVDSNRAPQDAALVDALEKLNWPPAVTLAEIGDAGSLELGDFLKDRRNARQVPHRLEECGYEQIRNPTAKDGYWKLKNKGRVSIYSRKELAMRERIGAAEQLVNDSHLSPVELKYMDREYAAGRR